MNTDHERLLRMAFNQVAHQLRALLDDPSGPLSDIRGTVLTYQSEAGTARAKLTLDKRGLVVGTPDGTTVFACMNADAIDRIMDCFGKVFCMCLDGPMARDRHRFDVGGFPIPALRPAAFRVDDGFMLYSRRGSFGAALVA